MICKVKTNQYLNYLLSVRIKPSDFSQFDGKPSQWLTLCPMPRVGSQRLKPHHVGRLEGEPYALKGARTVRWGGVYHPDKIGMSANLPAQVHVRTCLNNLFGQDSYPTIGSPLRSVGAGFQKI